MRPTFLSADHKPVEFKTEFATENHWLKFEALYPAVWSKLELKSEIPPSVFICK